jgi:hypothetical protein
MTDFEMRLMHRYYRRREEKEMEKVGTMFEVLEKYLALFVAAENLEGEARLKALRELRAMEEEYGIEFVPAARYGKVA